MSLNLDSLTIDLVNSVKDNLSDFYNEVENHMKEQPYSVTCAECGNKLICNKNVDSDFDLILEIHPCKCSSLDKD